MQGLARDRCTDLILYPVSKADEVYPGALPTLHRDQLKVTLRRRDLRFPSPPRREGGKCECEARLRLGRRGKPPTP